MKRIYLDNNSTTPCHPEVFASMQKYFCISYGNASSAHSFGRGAQLAIEEAREKIAGLINASPEEIIFCSGGTEANNHAIRGGIEICENRKIAVSEIEHSSILSVCKNLMQHSVELIYIQTNSDGIVIPDSLDDICTTDTGMIIVMLCNNETGAIQPVQEIAKFAKRRGLLFFCDAVQGLGKMEINVKNLGVDMMSFSAHKLYGPKGVGALYIRRGLKLPPLIYGGGQEKRLRAGTENVAGIVGFGKAAELARKELEERKNHSESLRNIFLATLKENLDDFKINTPIEKSITNTLNLSFSGVASEALVTALDLDGICVSSASACAGLSKGSHVLRAMKLSDEFVYSSLRVSFGIFNSEEDAKFAALKVAEKVNSIRRLSNPKK